MADITVEGAPGVMLHFPEGTDETIIRNEVLRSRGEEHKIPRPADPNESRLATGAKQMGAGFLGGVVGGVLDAPIDAVRFVNRTIGNVTGAPKYDPAPPYEAEKYVEKNYLPVPVEGYEGPRKVANVVGNIVAPTPFGKAKAAGTGAKLAGEIVPAISNGIFPWLARKGVQGVAAVPRIAGATGGAIAGQEGADFINDRIGKGIENPRHQELLRDMVNLVVSGGAAGLGAAGASKAGGYGVRKALGAPDSPTRLAEAEKAGIPPSIGLIGNRGAGWLEDGAAVLPGGGGPAFEARSNQYKAFDDSMRKTGERLRGGPAAGEITKGSIGADVVETGKKALLAMDNEITRLQEGLYQTGKDNLGSVGALKRKLAEIEGLDIEQSFKDQARARVDAFLERNNAAPIHPALDQRFRNQQSFYEQKLADPNTPPVDIPQLQAALDEVKRKIDDNTGVSYGAAKDERTNIRRQVGQDVTVNDREVNKLQDPLTETMKDAHRRGGGNDATFDTNQERTASIYTDRPTAAKVSKLEGKEGDAYNTVFSPKNEQSSGPLGSMEPYAPKEVAGLRADQLELKTRGESAGRPESPLHMDTKRIHEYWNFLPDTAKQAMEKASPGITAEMDRLSMLAKADDVRPKRAVPSKGSGSISAPAVQAAATGAGAKVGWDASKNLPGILRLITSLASGGVVPAAGRLYSAALHAPELIGATAGRPIRAFSDTIADATSRSARKTISDAVEEERR